MVSGDGLRKLDTHIQAILNAPPPSNATEMKSFVSLANYYSKFISKISSKLHPLYSLFCVVSRLQKSFRSN